MPFLGFGKSLMTLSSEEEELKINHKGIFFCSEGSWTLRGNWVLKIFHQPKGKRSRAEGEMSRGKWRRIGWAVAPHSSTLAWEIPWMEGAGGLQSMGSPRVGYDWATSLSRIGEDNGSPLQCSCLENPRDEGAWWAAVCGVAQNRTRLKRLSSSRMGKDK